MFCLATWFFLAAFELQAVFVCDFYKIQYTHALRMCLYHQLTVFASAGSVRGQAAAADHLQQA